jgi:hypothetical protein
LSLETGIPALTDQAVRLLGGAALGLGLIVTGLALCRHIAELGQLRRVARSLFPDGRIRSREDLVSLRQFLSAHIHSDPEKKLARRPWLRSSAAQSLRSGAGFCGDNARVAIRILQLGGVRAHRLYLRGPRWSHVVVEHRWNGSWRLFDGHADPATLPADADLGRIHTDDLARFPNANRALNPWTASGRVKMSCRWPALRWLRPWRPPHWLVLLGESPDLLYGGLGLIVTLCGALLLGGLM